MLRISDNAYLMARHVTEFYGVIPPDPKVIGADTLHFKPILTPPLQKFVRRAPSPLGYGLARLEHCIARVKISGRYAPKGLNMVFRKKSIYRFSGYNCTFKSPWLVD